MAEAKKRVTKTVDGAKFLHLNALVLQGVLTKNEVCRALNISFFKYQQLEEKYKNFQKVD